MFYNDLHSINLFRNHNIHIQAPERVHIKYNSANVFGDQYISFIILQLHHHHHQSSASASSWSSSVRPQPLYIHAGGSITQTQAKPSGLKPHLQYYYYSAHSLATFTTATVHVWRRVTTVTAAIEIATLKRRVALPISQRRGVIISPYIFLVVVVVVVCGGVPERGRQDATATPGSPSQSV